MTFFHFLRWQERKHAFFGATTPSIGVTMFSIGANLASTNENIASTNENMASTGVNMREFDEFRIMQAVCQKIGGTGPSDLHDRRPLQLSRNLSATAGRSSTVSSFFSGKNWKYNNKSIVHKLDKLEPKWV